MIPSAELAHAIHTATVDLGIDGTGVVQRIIESADGLIHRVEMLGSSFFYGTQQRLQANAFNYCAVDGCAIDGADADGSTAIELFTPPDEVVLAASSGHGSGQHRRWRCRVHHRYHHR